MTYTLETYARLEQKELVEAWRRQGISEQDIRNILLAQLEDVK